LWNPRDYQLRYVGKSNNPEKRLNDHIYSALEGKVSHRDDWIRSLLKEDLQPAIEILEEVDINEWEDAEKAWISDCRKYGLNLTNLSDGGLKNCGFSEYSKQKLRSKLINHPVSLETKEKIRKAHLGKPVLESSKQKTREAHKKHD